MLLEEKRANKTSLLILTNYKLKRFEPATVLQSEGYNGDHIKCKKLYFISQRSSLLPCATEIMINAQKALFSMPFLVR